MRTAIRLTPAFLGVVAAMLAFAAPALAAAPGIEHVETSATTVRFEGEVGSVEAGTYQFIYRQSGSECEGGSAVPVSPSMYLEGSVEADASGLTPSTEYTACLVVSTSGGTTVSTPVTFHTSAAASFGLRRLEVSATNRDGSPDLQAGSTPFKLTTDFALNPPEVLNEGEGIAERLLAAGRGLKDVRFELPPGFVGNPDATPKCTYVLFVAGKCPSDTAIGFARTELIKSGAPEGAAYTVWEDPVYNVEQQGGLAAEFGYRVIHDVPVLLEASVRTGGDYGVTVNVRNIPQAIAVLGSKVVIWGVPGESIHNSRRGECLRSPEEFAENEQPIFEELPESETGGIESEGCSTSVPLQPLLTNPTSCGESRTATMSVDDWEDPGNFATGENVFTQTATLPDLSGCEKLDFSPSISVQPDGTAGSTPTGLNVDVHVPQEATTNHLGLGEADVRSTTVALPPGVQVSPSASDGLQACSNAQIGFEGYRELDASGRQTPIFSPGAPSCPDASKIATVHIATPLLEHELTGSVYLAAPQNFAGLPENPFSSLIAMYLVAEEPEHGVLVKLPGEVSLNEATGQITTTFENTPQLPFSDLKLEFYGTDRAPLATPALCGTYSTESSFVPWSTPPGGASSSSAVHPPASFEITTGPGNTGTAGCSAPLPFAPALASETTNIQAGAFTPLQTTLGREDGQQQIQQVTLHYPPGVSGLLSGVKLCEEAQANAGTCDPESLIGESIVSVGLGNDPFTVTGGKAYITGPYEGAPFGLSIVNPAKAGPFDLQEGKPVVVRATINVDPHTAALTVTTNTPGEGHAIPSMIEGIPLQIKHVDVNVNRPGFTINPTNCTPTQVTGSVTSAEGTSSPVSIPFQVTNCASLKFAPDFKVSTSGKTSKARGASLTSTVTYPNAAPGTYANVTRVKVDLPKQLPSRLTTLQKACTNAQFEANPAGCPSESKIGYATVHTPLLPVPLVGPAIFVSHGGEAFPSLTMVLQGDNVTVDLVGTTNISKAGITSTTFKTLPDSPFTSFELTLPEGKFSALAANGNLCKPKLAMPTEFVGQNGFKINESTKISVTGCANSISISSHKVKGKTTTIQVSVPAAGKLTATGKGLSKASKTASGRETVSLVLNQKKGGKLKTNIKLTFTPSKGAKQTKTVTVRFKK
jgi:hypothetical protein